MRVQTMVQPHAQRRLTMGAPLLPPRVHTAAGVVAPCGGGARRVQEALQGVRGAGAESTRIGLGAGEDSAAAGLDSARGAALALLVLHRQLRETRRWKAYQ